MKRRLALILTAVAAFLPTVLAHDDAEYHLAGTVLCLDARSAWVLVEGTGEARKAAAEASMRQSLLGALERILASSSVAYEQQPSCANSEGFALIGVSVGYLDPATYIGFAEASYRYTVVMQVGTYTDSDALRETGMLPSLQFMSWASDLYSEAEEGAPFEEAILEESEKQMRNLVLYWWEDNAGGVEGWRRYAPQVLGTFAALLSAAAVLAVVRTRRGRR